MRLTMNVQNRNKSEYVTTSSPPFHRGQGAKEAHPLLMGEKPPTAVRRAANQNSLIASGNHTNIYYGNALVPKNQLYSSK